MEDTLPQLDIIYECDDLIAINKPHGLLVHRTKIAADATIFAVQLVRDYLNQRVHPAHRLDRKTSGVLLFAKHQEASSEVQQLFQNREVNKTYQAIVRGYINEGGTIDYPLTNEGKTKEAITSYKRTDTYQISVALGLHSTSRYSHVVVKPETGRFHQIRKHMGHIRHPIIGDRPHGCNKQNRLWKEKFQMDSMMLHACRLELEWKQKTIVIEADISEEYERVLSILQNT